jgi:hypothetical protein
MGIMVVVTGPLWAREGLGRVLDLGSAAHDLAC